MASLLDGLRIAVVEILRPGTRQQLGEREVLRQMYEASNTRATLPNTWYRLHNHAGDCVGFSFVCNCHTEYQLLSAFEWMRDYKCKACGAKFDLLKHTGIKTADGEIKTRPEEWERLFARLPIRPRLAGGPPRPRAFDTWSRNNSDEVQWDGAKPVVPEGWS
jgi:hypothetical protein